LVGALLGGGLGVLIAVAGEGEGEIFIANDHPIIGSQCVRSCDRKGWLNVQIVGQRRYLEITGSKNGRARKLMVDTLTGRLIADDGD
jgi:hypothetical protein